MKKLILGIVFLSVLVGTSKAQNKSGSAPGVSTEIVSTLQFDKYLKPLGWSTATRPSSPSTGVAGYNTDSSAWEFYNGSIWRKFASGVTSGGSGTVTSVGLTSTDLLVSGSPITTSGSITANINTNAVTYAKFQQVAPNTLVGNATGSTANTTAVTAGTGITIAGGTISVNPTYSDTFYAVNGLQLLGTTSPADSIGLGGTLYQNTTITTGTHQLTFNTGFSTLVQTSGNAAWNYGNTVITGSGWRFDYINAAGTHTNILGADSTGLLDVNTIQVTGTELLSEGATSASTYTVTLPNLQVYSGSTATTWTLPTLASTLGLLYRIKNRGSGTITLNAASGDHLYTTSSVTTISITAGTSATIFSDGLFWNVL